jgi:hypothetical protein
MLQWHSFILGNLPKRINVKLVELATMMKEAMDIMAAPVTFTLK